MIVRSVLVVLLAGVVSCSNDNANSNVVADESVAFGQNLPMHVEVSDAMGDGQGVVLFSFSGSMPNLPPDEQGNTPVETDDTVVDARVLVKAKIIAQVGGLSMQNTGLRLTPDHFASFLRGERRYVLNPEEQSEDQIRPAIPLSYRNQDETLLKREIADIKMTRLNELAVRVELGLGEAVDYHTNQSVPGASPTALIQFTGPLALRCTVMRAYEPFEDLNWQTPFCARVKAEFGLARYVD